MWIKVRVFFRSFILSVVIYFLCLYVCVSNCDQKYKIVAAVMLGLRPLLVRLLLPKRCIICLGFAHRDIRDVGMPSIFPLYRYYMGIEQHHIMGK